MSAHLPVVLDVVQGVRLRLPAFGEADALRVWRQGPGESGFTRVAAVGVGTELFVDDGSVPADACASDPGNLPPDQNVGVADYAVSVSLPLASAPHGWRLYRAGVSAGYGPASLVEEVVTVAEEFDPESAVVTTFLDVGDPLQAGSPATLSGRMRFAPFTFEVAPELPASAGYPEGYPLVVGDVLHILRDGQWRAITATGGGGGAPGAPAVLTSPDGSRWVQGVDDTGALVMSQTFMPGPPALPQNVMVS